MMILYVLTESFSPGNQIFKFLHLRPIFEHEVQCMCHASLLENVRICSCYVTQCAEHVSCIIRTNLGHVFRSHLLNEHFDLVRNVAHGLCFSTCVNTAQKN